MVNLCSPSPSLWIGGARPDRERHQSVPEQYQRKSLSQIQSLPDKTHNAAVLALLGILPLERVIHKNMLNLFGRWILFEGVEKDIAVRQLATKSEAEVSWFNGIKQLLEMYS